MAKHDTKPLPRSRPLSSNRRSFCATMGASALFALLPTSRLIKAQDPDDFTNSETSRPEIRFPYDLSEDISLSPCRIDISTRSKSPLNKLLYGFNTNMASSHSGGPTYDHPAVVQAVSILRPGLLRFPGGTIANWYNWKTDDFDTPPDRAPGYTRKLIEYRKNRRKYGYAGFRALVQHFHIEPIITVNLFTQTPEDAVAWFERMKADGLRIRYCELGNEVYTKEQKSSETETPGGYVTVAKKFGRALKDWDPDIRISVNTSRRAVRWTSQLAKENFFDAVVYHTYPGSHADTVRPETIIDYLSVARLFDEMTRDFRRDFPNRPVWMTEWNISKLLHKSAYGHTALHALCNATWWLQFLNHPDTLQLAAYHALAGAGFGPLEIRGQKAVIYPEFGSWELIGKLHAQYDTVLLTNMSKDQPNGWRFPACSARAFAGDKGPGLFLVNNLPIPKRVEITIDGTEFRQGGEADYLSMPSLNWSDAIPLPGSFLKTGRFDGVYTAPPFSVNLIHFSPR